MMKPLTCGIPPTVLLWSNSDLLIISDWLCFISYINILLLECRLKSHISATLMTSVSGQLSDGMNYQTRPLVLKHA